VAREDVQLVGQWRGLLVALLLEEAEANGLGQLAVVLVARVRFHLEDAFRHFDRLAGIVERAVSVERENGLDEEILGSLVALLVTRFRENGDYVFRHLDRLRIVRRALAPEQHRMIPGW
jgi:hypothetical protein